MKVGPAKGLGSLPFWFAMRARVRLAVDWPLSQAEDMLRKTEPSKLVALRDVSMSAVPGELKAVFSALYTWTVLFVPSSKREGSQVTARY